MSIRTLVVASSGEVTQPINEVLCTLPDFELLGNCRNGLEAQRWMAGTSPDLLLLDMELPGLNGFEWVDTLGIDAPNLILLSNSPQHALQAFEMEAIDLLSKPPKHERLRQALARAIQHIRKPALEADLQRSEMDRLLLRSGGRLVFVEPQDVQWIEANDNYVVFHTMTGHHTVRMTMNKIESILRMDLFVRIHRSTIVNIEHVRELRPLAHGDYSVFLTNGVELTLTRNYRRRVHELVPAWKI